MGAQRATDPNFGVGETGFADGFPILLTTEASLRDVNARLIGSQVDIVSFRPNVHVSGCMSFEEDEIPSVAFRGRGGDAEVRLRLIKPCSRCTVPAVDPQLGKRRAGGEPLRTLRRY